VHTSGIKPYNLLGWELNPQPPSHNNNNNNNNNNTTTTPIHPGRVFPLLITAAGCGGKISQLSDARIERAYKKDITEKNNPMRQARHHHHHHHHHLYLKGTHIIAPGVSVMSHCEPFHSCHVTTV